WVATGSLVTARQQHTATLLLSGKVLLTGGLTTSTVLQSSAEIFDPAASGGVGAFAATGSMGTRRYMHTASVLTSGKVLVAGGNDSVTAGITNVELYDPTAGTFTVASALAGARYSHTSTTLGGGKVLVAGGINAAGT